MQEWSMLPISYNHAPKRPRDQMPCDRNQGWIVPSAWSRLRDGTGYVMVGEQRHVVVMESLSWSSISLARIRPSTTSSTILPADTTGLWQERDVSVSSKVWPGSGVMYGE